MYDNCVNVVSKMYLLIVVCCCNRKVVERNDRTIAHALTSLAQVMQAQQNPQVEGVESCGLDKFIRNKPPTFKGRYDPEGAHVWLQEIEKIF